MIRVRSAKKSDAAAIVALVRALARFERLSGPTPAAARRLVRDGFGRRRRFEALVAEVDGAVEAYAIFFPTYSTFRARPTLFLEDLFVHPRVRRRGVATRLLARLRSIARDRGYGRIEWMVLDWNRGAQMFYERAGARALGGWRLYRVELVGATRGIRRSRRESPSAAAR